MHPIRPIRAPIISVIFLPNNSFILFMANEVRKELTNKVRGTVARNVACNFKVT